MSKLCCFGAMILCSSRVSHLIARRAFEKLPHCQFDKVDKDPPFLSYFVWKSNSIQIELCSKNCHEIFQSNYSGNTIQEFCNFDFIWLIFCFVSVSSPKVTGMTEYLSVSQGGKIKLKCKIAGSPLPKVTWLKDGRPLHHDFHISIKSKRKRSILRLSDAQGRDGGKYTCRATNVLGEQSQTTSISVRVLGNHPFSIIEFSRLKLFLILAPDPPASTCPIEQFCLNGGKCLYYPMIGEHVCR